ncbi:MAG: diacylglycerol kinase, partial [Armatimonadota bacterium]
MPRPRPRGEADGKTVVESFAHALEGVIHAFRTQRHMRAHLVIIAVVMLAALFLRIEEWEILALFVSIALVLLTELFNTAVEMAVDLVTQRYHAWAKIIKDVAAGAVLVASANAILVGVVVFLRPRRWTERTGELLQHAPRREPMEAILVSALGVALLSVLVVALKARGRAGTFLAGGVVSGHAALAFFLAASILFITGSLEACLLALGLAVL